MAIKRWLASMLAVLSCLAPSIVRAADTGSISGVVFDQGGQLVEGATVRLTGAPLPGERVATTDSNGAYRFPLLLPGSYVLEVSKQAAGTAKRAVTVQVDVDTQVDIVLGLNLDETIEVSAAAPVVDLRTTEVNFNYDAQLIKELPLQRTYAGLFQLIPGVAENNAGTAGLVSGGASRQDNTYLIDGVNKQVPAEQQIPKTQPDGSPDPAAVVPIFCPNNFAAHNLIKRDKPEVFPAKPKPPANPPANPPALLMV